MDAMPAGGGSRDLRRDLRNEIFQRAANGKRRRRTVFNGQAPLALFDFSELGGEHTGPPRGFRYREASLLALACNQGHK